MLSIFQSINLIAIIAEDLVTWVVDDHRTVNVSSIFLYGDVVWKLRAGVRRTVKVFFKEI